ncbi:MAG: E3 binding domain-containing protein, partial [Planctomycetaceae bacterium]|nr:E3 binding domain-containing protein [Planctomycetaceae bacterium]
MSVEIQVPSVGESISEVFIGEWYVQEGDWVDVDQNLVGLETDKATFDVPSPQAGVIKSISKKAGSTAEIGDVIAVLEPGKKPSGTAESSSGGDNKAAEKATAHPAQASSPTSSPSTAHVMPAAARLAGQEGVSPSGVAGSGPGGRVLKEDVQRALEGGKQTPEVVGAGAREERRVPMSPMRQTIARRLVEAQSNAALLTTFNECDMSAIKQLREQYQDQFVKKYGIKLGFMSFFV